MRFLALGFSLSFVVACMTSTTSGGGGPSPRPRPAPVDHDGHGDHADHHPGTPKREAKPAGAQCQAASECESGVCEGEGCGDTPGTCAPRNAPAPAIARVLRLRRQDVPRER
ncbi:MAG: hypothetical protein QM784_12485 [Polyangiaceae bacterium]